MKTTIQVETDTVSRLKRLKVYPKEPIGDVVSRLVTGIPDEFVSDVDQMRDKIIEAGQEKIREFYRQQIPIISI
jgi:hypothetical protein